MSRSKRATTPRLNGWILGIRLAAFIATLVAAAGGYFSWTDPENPYPRLLLLVAGVIAGSAGFVSWILEERRKLKIESASEAVEELLEAERLRVMTITNGAFVPTLAALQDLAAMEFTARASEISGFRQAVVERACDLVANESPRAAFFRVQDPGARLRVMKPRPYIAQRARVDEFTSEFDESSGREPDIWTLIDSADRAVLCEEVDLPAKAYRSYISAPVRAGGIPFGMLTLNVLEAGGLSKEDADFLLVLARILAVAETLVLSPAHRLAYRKMSKSRSTIVR